jgi:hypothetical protein
MQKTLWIEAGEYLFAGISPSLGPCCSQFIHYEKEIPQEFWHLQVKAALF